MSLDQRPTTLTFAFTPEQDQLRSAVRAFVAARSSESEIRRVVSDDANDAMTAATSIWMGLATLGVAGILLPERAGGVGGGIVDVMVVCEELGRGLVPCPFLASAVSATALLVELDDDAALARWGPSLADGSVVATVVAGSDTGLLTDAPSIRASERDGIWYLDGEVKFVLDANASHLFIVPARTRSGVCVFAIAPEAAGVKRRALPTLDATRPQSVVSFVGAPAERLKGNVNQALERSADIACVALAAEQVGGARRLLDMAVEYATVREQFGRPIGSFQAIKLKCSEMLLDLEPALSTVYAAGWALEGGLTSASELSSTAKALASQAHYRCAAECIQVHGGIGFTWEHPAHLYFKRAVASQALFGSPGRHRARIADLLGLGR